MSNTEIELEILSMRRGGYSYADIESTLGVSSKTIAKVIANQKATESMESTNNKDSRINSFQKRENSFPFHANPDYDDVYPGTFQPESEKPDQPIPNNNDGKQFPVDNTLPERKSAEEIRLEELREQNKHELQLKNFDWKQEKEERELSLQEQEADIERRKLEDRQKERQKKIDVKRRSFLMRLKDLAGQCRRGTWEYDDIFDLSADANSLYNESMDFCNKHSIPFDGTDYEKNLGEICDSLKKTVEEAEEDDYVYWDPGITLRRQLRKAHQVTF